MSDVQGDWPMSAEPIPPGMMVVKCHVCDLQFLFPVNVLMSMRVPSTFCIRCYRTYDDLTLRQWFKLDMAIQQLNAQEAWIKQHAPPTPAPRVG